VAVGKDAFADEFFADGQRGKPWAKPSLTAEKPLPTASGRRQRHWIR